MYNVLFVSSSGFRIVGFMATYGEETGPNRSKIFPTVFKFSSTTVAPIFGVFSTFTIMFLLGLIWRTWPSLCKILNSPR